MVSVPSNISQPRLFALLPNILPSARRLSFCSEYPPFPKRSFLFASIALVCVDRPSPVIGWLECSATCTRRWLSLLFFSFSVDRQAFAGCVKTLAGARVFALHSLPLYVHVSSRPVRASGQHARYRDFVRLWPARSFMHGGPVSYLVFPCLFYLNMVRPVRVLKLNL
ncbi:hypothetical protein P152DRAFT_317707 [Eremomyces bilateralis CBS 781.70]|uniref:Uncharacterized protein n=1 Tax=Eremomyces bilateralis CBS 781.70 TaxID=1392243 RepID=A0A6G1G6A6_9PEZI|nr:uncharacterized protein P152DRAFT_317707 [Eremomyces bilateralis CBS 781.70]KAF1813410.1 hypothetical protein P152DRAFT_317707 [Eremomyces bilateralis CBS 781.70]